MKFFALSLILISFNSYGEYRVYQYILKKPFQENVEIINSTLDPVSYGAYNGGKLNLDYTYLRTWICPGHTANRGLCPSPYKKEILELL